MRRNERRVSARSERIIHGGDASYKPRADGVTRMPRSQSKIRELDDRGEPAGGFDDSMRRHFAADAFGAVGADVAEAAAALSTRRGAGGAARVTPPRGKGGALPPPPPPKRFTLAGLPKPLKHLLAGAFSGGVSKTATAPLEAVRMKLMVGAKGATVAEVVASTWAKSGLRGFFAGNMADVIRTAPQKSVQLAAFDAYKKLLGRRNPETGRLETNGLATTLAGAAAGVTSTVTCFPLEVLRTRLACSSEYRNLLHAAVAISRAEGPAALFGGLGPSLAGVIPYAGANLGMYDGLRWAYCRVTGEERVPRLGALVIGSVAGVTAATATFPLEVVRRRMMMGAKYANTLAALSAISASEGTGALFKGCFLNWVKLAPSAGLSFYFYEVAKDALGLNEAEAAAAAAAAAGKQKGNTKGKAAKQA